MGMEKRAGEDRKRDTHTRERERDRDRESRHVSTITPAPPALSWVGQLCACARDHSRGCAGPHRYYIVRSIYGDRSGGPKIY